MSASKSKGPKRLSYLLTEKTGTLRSLRSRALTLEQATQTLQKHLPSGMAGHWQVTGLEGETLAVSVESATWATGLRARQNDLLKAAATLTEDPPTRLQLRIQTPRHVHPSPPGPRLSETGAAALESAADGMVDPRLGKSLRRLASRAKRTS